MQLVAYGAQDIYLTGNPQITFFKVVYRRHTNFAIECIELTLNGNPDFGRKSTVLITRNGDLATRMYLRVVTQAFTPGSGSNMAWVRKLGHALLCSVEVEIGGSRMDKQYGIWLDIWHELARPVGHRERGYNKMIGDVPELTNFDGTTKPSYTLFLPLQHWFCRNPGLALPLIALQYHEVRLHFEFTAAASLIVQDSILSDQSTLLHMQDASLLVDYIYLDSEERRRFAQVGHEYLIELLQFTGEESVQNKTQKFKLGFNHPSKELIWALRCGLFTTGSPFLAYTNKDNWHDALDVAAKRLVLSKFSTTNVSATGVDVNNAGAIRATGVIDVIVLDSTGQPVAVPAATQLYYFAANDIVIAGTSLMSRITNAKLTIRLVGANNTAVASFSVTGITHTLSVRDISFPLNAAGVAVVRNDIPAARANLDVMVYQWNNYGLLLDGTYNPIDTGLIQLNGHDRFDVREGSYFNYVQPQQHHTNTPADGINVYSFALNPEEHQPSGSANLSRIDNTQLNLTFADSSRLVYTTPAMDLPFLTTGDTKLYVFDFSYNILRIMSGMGGLAYAN